jgi:PAS domain S-box-containing protein
VIVEAIVDDDAVSGTLTRIQEAFSVFERQSSTLRSSYEHLEQDLSEANRQLNSKNRTLEVNVEELRQVSSRLSCILESLTDGVLVVGCDMTVERCNPTLAAILGQGRDALEGVPYAAIDSPLLDADRVSDVLTTGLPTEDEQRLGSDAAGRPVIVLAGAAPILTVDGDILGVVEVFRDMTQIHQLEERISCQKRMAALGEMAASVAHEIRNPLGTIEGFARLLKRDLAEQPDSLRLASKIVEGAQTLNYVITNLLTYARPMLLQCELFSVNRLLLETRDYLEAKAATANVTLDVDMPGEDVVANGDIRQLRQVLLNIGANAVEACEEEGGHVRMAFACEAGTDQFVITDNGCGVPADEKNRIFDPFFTRKHGGTGLGLSLSHKIIEAHGGAIVIRDGDGNGTVFVVSLPR